jgi:hypothetical protein
MLPTQSLQLCHVYPRGTAACQELLQGSLGAHGDHGAECADAFQKLITDASGGPQAAAEPPTGFLLMFPLCITAQLEAKSEAVNSCLARFLEEQEALGVRDARVISLTDDIPQRAHSSWAAAFAGGEVKAQADAADATMAVAAASDINLKFISFGQQLQCAPDSCGDILSDTSVVMH